jgi:hypothetical protein
MLSSVALTVVANVAAIPSAWWKSSRTSDHAARPLVLYSDGVTSSPLGVVAKVV